MLNILTKLASQLDSIGHRSAADKIDALLAKFAADESKDEQAHRPPTKEEGLRSIRPITKQLHDIDDDFQDNMRGDIAARHQYELDKQHLLQDLAGQVEQGMQDKVKQKYDLSHKLVNPYMRLDLIPGGFVKMDLEQNEADHWISVLIKYDDEQTDRLKFNLNSQRGPIGPAWVDTVAGVIVKKILESQP